MGKLVLFFVLASFAQSELRSNVAENQTEEVREYAYWETFSKVYNKTADYWEAESAALEAESIASSQTGIDEWLDAHSENINDIKFVDSCAVDS